MFLIVNSNTIFAKKDIIMSLRVNVSTSPHPPINKIRIATPGDRPLASRICKASGDQLTAMFTNAAFLPPSSETMITIPVSSSDEGASAISTLGRVVQVWNKMAQAEQAYFSVDFPTEKVREAYESAQTELTETMSTTGTSASIQREIQLSFLSRPRIIPNPPKSKRIQVTGEIQTRIGGAPQLTRKLRIALDPSLQRLFQNMAFLAPYSTTTFTLPLPPLDFFGENVPDLQRTSADIFQRIGSVVQAWNQLTEAENRYVQTYSGFAFSPLPALREAYLKASEVENARILTSNFTIAEEDAAARQIASSMRAALHSSVAKAAQDNPEWTAAYEQSKLTRSQLVRERLDAEEPSTGSLAAAIHAHEEAWQPCALARRNLEEVMRQSGIREERADLDMALYPDLI